MLDKPHTLIHRPAQAAAEPLVQLSGVGGRRGGRPVLCRGDLSRFPGAILTGRGPNGSALALSSGLQPTNRQDRNLQARSQACARRSE